MEEHTNPRDCRARSGAVSRAMRDAFSASCEIVLMFCFRPFIGFISSVLCKMSSI